MCEVVSPDSHDLISMAEIAQIGLKWLETRVNQLILAP